jgi:5'-methylthioadenosine phosphorylase
MTHSRPFGTQFGESCSHADTLRSAVEGPAVSLVPSGAGILEGNVNSFPRDANRVRTRAEPGLQQAEIGIIGGSGLYTMPGLSNPHQIEVTTPFGDPSDVFVAGELEGRQVVFLARHGRGHRILPTELNFRANIFAMKKLGVQRIISVSAVGSLKLEHKPTEFVVPDQFIDRTSQRPSTFFGNGIVGHVAFGDPVCATVSKAIHQGAESAGVVAKRGGVYVCMEGPQFSTRAESNLYRSWGADIIGMTNLQEAKLAREAEICYATMAMVTDYDCWHDGHDSVTVDQVVAVLHQNSANAARAVRAAVAAMPAERTCPCINALQFAILTSPEAIPEAIQEKLAPLLGKYIRKT